ncbi:GNAT family N-acetyltransferase [Catenuloplanes sp. NPDC051500]|uniref:GNAT family N-acetyltransferase n=1 Tax=Catenuloplanes sp. NPDC051500 TaxID=3363959 RepID=UPI003787505E
MGTYLETARLTLRHFTADDVDLLVELDSDPDVMAFLTGGAPTPRTEIEEHVLPRFMSDYPRLGVFAAVERDSGTFIGWFAMSAEAELGYRLRKEFWGRGYATEGSRALIDRTFAEHDVDRVWAVTMAVNTRSRRVMVKAGLTYVRTFFPHFDDPIPGTEKGEVEYAVTRAERIG